MQQTVGGEAQVLNDLYLAVSEFAQSFDPNAVSGGDAKRILETASRAESVLGVVKALALVRIDETDAYKSSGHRSAADYGAAKTGTSPADAQRAIKTARRARRLPSTDEAMRKGDLSQRQADEIADAASVNPDAEDDLLRSARTDDLGTLKRKAKRAKFSADRDAEARNRRIHARRSLRHWTDEEGAFHAHLRTTPEAGARFLAGLEAHRRAAFEAARKAGRREAPEAYNADALDALARGATPEPAASNPGNSPASSGEETGTAQPRSSTERPNHRATRRARRPGGTGSSDLRSEPNPGTDRDEVIDLADDPPPGAAPPRSAPPPGSRSQPRATVHLNVDLAAYRRGHLEPGDICEIPGVGPISLSTARALLGDATIELILKKGNDIRSVVHLGRTVTAAQRRALETRDPCCIRPGCGRTLNLEIDHRTGWAINHETTLDDLARLCPYCHDLKTHHGHTYTGGPGTWTWHVPDGVSGHDDASEPNEFDRSTVSTEQAKLFAESG